MIDHIIVELLIGVIDDVDYIQHGARADVQRFTRGRVVPSLFSVHSTLGGAAADSSTHVVYWKTYVPPRLLMDVPSRVCDPSTWRQETQIATDVMSGNMFSWTFWRTTRGINGRSLRPIIRFDIPCDPCSDIFDISLGHPVMHRLEKAHFPTP